MARVDLQDAAAWWGRFEQAYTRAAYQGLLSAALRGLQTIQVRIVPSRSPQPVDRGVYRAGWEVVPEPDGVVIQNLVPHAVFIEHGVRAANVKVGRAMLQALAEWVRRKGLQLEEGQTPMGVAWAIAQSMRRRGIFRGGTGMGIMREWRDQYMRQQVVEEVSREIGRAIRRGG